MGILNCIVCELFSEGSKKWGEHGCRGGGGRRGGACSGGRRGVGVVKDGLRGCMGYEWWVWV